MRSRAVAGGGGVSHQWRRKRRESSGSSSLTTTGPVPRLRLFSAVHVPPILERRLCSVTDPQTTLVTWLALVSGTLVGPRRPGCDAGSPLRDCGVGGSLPRANEVAPPPYGRHASPALIA